MAQKVDRSLASDHKFAHLDELHLVGIENRVAKGEYVSARELATALRKHGSRPIPSCVLEYLCRLLEGKVTKRKGRKALPKLEMRRRRMIMGHFYRRYLTWLRNRKARYGHLDGWPRIRQTSWWRGPPNERAARMVAQRFGYGAESWRTVQNEISSRE